MLDLYQNGTSLGSAVGQATGLGDPVNTSVASLTVAPRAEAGPLLIHVFNYSSGIVTYRLGSS